MGTPTAIMGEAGRGGAAGVVYGDGAALGGLREGGVGALDRTGTLGEGGPGVTDLIARPGGDEAIAPRARPPRAAVVAAFALAVISVVLGLVPTGIVELIDLGGDGV